MEKFISIENSVLEKRNGDFLMNTMLFPEDFPNPNTTIWRYMDLDKFLSLISNESLYFVNALRLNDEFEGSLSQHEIKELEDNYRSTIGYIQDESRIEEYVEENREVRKKEKEDYVINCWHMNESESAAMWKLYSTSKRSIAIKSSINRLMNSLSNIDFEIHLGKVRYIDFKKDKQTIKYPVYRFIYKRHSFDYEKEFRAIFRRMDMNAEYSQMYRNDFIKGINIPIDPNILINGIYISPKSQDWFLKLVREIKSKYGISARVRRTELDDNALF